MGGVLEWAADEGVAKRVVIVGQATQEGRDELSVLGDVQLFQTDPDWHDLLPFHEYFDGDTGRGIGASHQTGWTGLVADLVIRSGHRLPEDDAAVRGRASDSTNSHGQLA